MTAVQAIVNALLEDEEDLDSDWKDVVLFQTSEEVDQWLKTNMPKLGFKYQEMGVRGWERRVGNRMVSVGLSTRPGEALMVLYYYTMGNQWQNKEMKSVDCGIPILMQLLDWRIIR